MNRIIYYSATERAFCFSDVHGPKEYEVMDEETGDVVTLRNSRILDDAVEVSEADYAALMKAQDEYATIEPDKKGYPRAVPATDDRLSEIARAKRDGLLASTDWTQAADVPEATRAKYAAYRQALRDVPSQPGFPRTVEWPELDK